VGGAALGGALVPPHAVNMTAARTTEEANRSMVVAS
jgi:hypothetical protein